MKRLLPGALAVLMLGMGTASFAGVPCPGASAVWSTDYFTHIGDTTLVVADIFDCYGSPLPGRNCIFGTSPTGAGRAIDNPAVTNQAGRAQGRVVWEAGGAATVTAVVQGVSLVDNGQVFVRCPKPVQVKQQLLLHQGGQQNPTDLHFKAWQKEDDIEITGWSVSVAGAPVDAVTTSRGDQPGKAHTERGTTNGSKGDPDNGMHAVDVDITFMPPGVPYCTWLRIKIVLTLTAWNALRISDLHWTYGLLAGGETYQSDIAPDQGWYLTPPTDVPGFPDSWYHGFAVENDDTVSGMTIKNVGLAVRQDSISLDSLENFTDWDTTLVGSAGSYLPPGGSLWSGIFGPEGSPSAAQYVYVHYQVFDVEEEVGLAGMEPPLLLDVLAIHYDYYDPGGAAVETVPTHLPFELHQNRPNPFVGETVITYELPEPGPVNLVIYDVRGRRVRSLVDEIQEAGSVALSWDGRNDEGAAVSAGIYFMRLGFGGKNTTKQLVLLK